MNIILNQKLTTAISIMYPEDLLTIRSFFKHQLIGTADWIIQYAWKVFSNTYSAQWLLVTSKRLTEFEAWINDSEDSF